MSVDPAQRLVPIQLVLDIASGFDLKPKTGNFAVAGTVVAVAVETVGHKLEAET